MEKWSGMMIPDPFLFPIPDPGSRGKIYWMPVPGSGSATLVILNVSTFVLENYFFTRALQLVTFTILAFQLLIILFLVPAEKKNMVPTYCRYLAMVVFNIYTWYRWYGSEFGSRFVSATPHTKFRKKKGAIFREKWQNYLNENLATRQNRSDWLVPVPSKNESVKKVGGWPVLWIRFRSNLKLVAGSGKI